jgi:hypothetical protein
MLDSLQIHIPQQISLHQQIEAVAALGERLMVALLIQEETAALELSLFATFCKDKNATMEDD